MKKYLCTFVKLDKDGQPLKGYATPKERILTIEQLKKIDTRKIRIITKKPLR